MLILLSVWVPATHAATLVYSVVADNNGAFYEGGTTGSFGLTQFDPRYGTLQSVVLTVTGSGEGGYIWADNQSAVGNKTITLTLLAEMTLVLPGIDQMLFFQPEQSTNKLLTANHGGELDWLGPDSLRLYGTSYYDVQIDNPVDLNPYIGTGQITYTFDGSTDSSIRYGGLPAAQVIQTSSPSLYGFTAEVVYTYEANDPPYDPGGPGGNVPEPGTLSMGLVLAGLSLVGWGRRFVAQRRNASAP